MARHILAGALIVALGLALLVSDRYLVLSDQYRTVAHLADVPRGAEDALPADTGDMALYGVHVPARRSGIEALADLLVAAGVLPAPVRRDPPAMTPAYGQSIREWTFLGMPFGWFDDMGPALYRRTPSELLILPLTPDDEAQLRSVPGMVLKQGAVFPFWAHCWGWLYVAGLALWGWLHHRATVKRREAEGII